MCSKLSFTALKRKRYLQPHRHHTLTSQPSLKQYNAPTTPPLPPILLTLEQHPHPHSTFQHIHCYYIIIYIFHSTFTSKNVETDSESAPARNLRPKTAGAAKCARNATPVRAHQKPAAFRGNSARKSGREPREARLARAAPLCRPGAHCRKSATAAPRCPEAREVAGLHPQKGRQNERPARPRR